MVKISKKLEYSLMVLKFMRERSMDELSTAREICDNFKIPFDTTAKVMQIMAQQGILRSSQGVYGGYLLQKDLNTLNYLQLAELIEGKKIWNDCEKLQCNLLSTCNITGPIRKLNQYLNYFFQGLSVEELLQENLISPIGLIQKTRNS